MLLFNFMIEKIVSCKTILISLYLQTFYSFFMKKKYSSVHYQEYLQLEKIIGAQKLKSEIMGKPAHDEMIFIITHQVYELWFKLILHELASVLEMFRNETLSEKNIITAVARLNRIIAIQSILVDQIKVLETMTALDFLDFRNYLLPASGFQSYQFRLVEVLLGLKEKDRLTYNQKAYSSVFDKKQQKKLRSLEEGKSLLEMVESWLERIPFLEFGNFNFLEQYKKAVDKMLKHDREAINSTDYITKEEKSLRLRMLSDTQTYFMTVLDEKKHNAFIKDGRLHFSYKATMAALLIFLYKDEPILHLPYQLLVSVIKIDEQFTVWRYRHAQMVQKMLGKKIGTGGSSGHDYLKGTTEKHKIFTDLYNIFTLLIPRSDLPKLPDNLKMELG